MRRSASGISVVSRRRWFGLWLMAFVVSPLVLTAAPRAAALEERQAGFVVRQAMSDRALGPGALAFDHTCTPDTFRPNELVVIECVASSTNEGQDTLTDVGWSVGSTYSGSLPDYFFVWSERDGDFQPVSSGGLMFGGYDLEPGQTVVTHTVLLLRMSEGTFETELDLSAAGEEVLTKPIRFAATENAADPPGDLLVTKTLVGGGGPDGTPLQVANYETKITNQGSSAVTDLTITDRSDYVDLLASAPMPASRRNDVHLAVWDLASFGKDSLAPGQSVVVHTTYVSTDESDCSYMTSGVVAEANVGGKAESFAARPADTVPVGNCETGDGMDGAVTGLGRGGDGPAAEGDVLWAAAVVLAGGGVALVVAARLMRRRSRR